jgi:hypothetical protein
VSHHVRKHSIRAAVFGRVAVARCDVSGSSAVSGFIVCLPPHVAVRPPFIVATPARTAPDDPIGTLFRKPRRRVLTAIMEPHSSAAGRLL